MRLPIIVAILAVVGQSGCDNPRQNRTKQQPTAEEIKKQAKDKELEALRLQNKRIEDNGGVNLLLGTGNYEAGFYHSYFPVVGTVKSNSAAHSAKMQPGDRILTFNDQSLGSPAITIKKTAKKVVVAPSNRATDIAKAKAAAVVALKKAIESSRGKDVTIVIRRDGKNRKLTLKVPDNGNSGIEDVRGDKW